MTNDNIEINLEPTTTETNNIEINVEAGTKIPVNPADMIPAENTTKKKTNKRTIKKKDDEDESLPVIILLTSINFSFSFNCLIFE